MNRIIVDLPKPEIAKQEPLPVFDDFQKPKKRSRIARIFAILASVVAFLLLIAGVAGYFYWQSLKGTPQYSLALIVDAARRDDQKAIDELVDINAVVDDFLPQITTKAIELYGRGLQPQTIARVSQVTVPVLPAIKDRARDELPRVIREKTERFESVPFAAMVLGADRYLDISIEGDIADVKSKLAGRPLEIKMKRQRDRWRIVGVKDEALALQISQKIGQEIIAIAAKGGINDAGNRLGVKNLEGILRQAEDIFR